MTILLIEDETLAADRLKNMLFEVDANVELVAQLKSVETSVQWLQTNPHPNLILSDIRLLDGLCFEIFERVKVDVPVIFTTAYDQYAMKAFEVNSIDYLLKPVEPEKLRIALEKANRRVVKSEAQPTINYTELIKLIHNPQQQYKSRFMVRLGQKIVAIAVEKIAYFFSESKLTYLVTNDQKKYPIDQTLDELTSLLDPRIFFRINRQFIITFQSIAEIHPYFKGRMKLNLLPTTTEEVIISSERTPEFKKWIDQ
ncbi:DNA-binding response regulator [Chryseotalea sanaruensis]|uniref:DNA-binding response regulator n=1 Tax=Chryseotalea sanaruensis TaxID=2482724 RepID=A0A401U8B7_9BACT|nr:LytTR family DNA-binding domain-containing protein [Chryseotalea sanaruensis]GCC51130.1 DNA-binding response regulator [Chryseotalea sanaruensis]